VAPGFFRAGTPGVAGNRVVWGRDPLATAWDGSGYYGDSVDQTRVDALIEQGMRLLTGAADGASAWRQVISDYVAGKKIAIKVNLNNAEQDGYHIDATPGTINGIVAGLKSIGVAESDIYVIDPSRPWPSYVAAPILARYPGVLLWDSEGSQGHQVTFDYDSSAVTTIHHSHPAISDSNFPLQLAEADYLIHLPILKGHGVAEVSLTFKNLFGMIKKWQCSKYHDYALPGRPNYSYDQNPIHDLYGHTLVRDKSVLVVGDGLFGQRDNSESGVPTAWNLFDGEFPNSIFLATDSVAIDSVMFDFLNAELSRSEQSQLYLHRAQELGLGVHEHWNNASDKQYATIDFQAFEPGEIPPSDPLPAPQNLHRTDVRT
jgi:uncharacterized protein (DUF362 family)